MAHERATRMALLEEFAEYLTSWQRTADAAKIRELGGELACLPDKLLDRVSELESAESLNSVFLQLAEMLKHVKYQPGWNFDLVIHTDPHPWIRARLWKWREKYIEGVAPWNKDWTEWIRASIQSAINKAHKKGLE